MPRALRGEVWQIDFGLAAKVRPALIYSVPFFDDERALYAVIPHTTALRKTRFELPIQVRGLDYGAFDIQNLGPISEARLMRRLAVLAPDQLKQVDRMVILWLGI